MRQGVLTEVRGILLQYINGQQLDTITPESPLALTYPELGLAAIDCLEKIVPLDVLHGDVRVANFIVRYSDGHVFLVDFAHSILRKPNESDVLWKKRTTYEREASAMKDFLQNRGLIKASPAAALFINEA